jgi:hypothetical protein
VTLEYPELGLTFVRHPNGSCDWVSWSEPPDESDDGTDETPAIDVDVVE